MNQTYNVQNTPPAPGERRHQQTAGTVFTPGTSHTGLQGTPGGLLRSTLISLGAALFLLVAVVLPAEYNIDPLGVGAFLGLTEMGGIKAQLSEEAAADAAALANAPSPEVLARLAAIEAQLNGMTALLRAGARQAVPPQAPETAAPEAATPGTAAPAAPAAAPPPQTAEPAWRDEVRFVLTPGEGIELKLVMNEGAVAEFEWSANGSVLNFDTHGDGGGQSVRYEQGRSVPGQSDELIAAFTGKHGWFFRNRTDQDVTLTLRVRGDYIELIRTA